MDVLSASKELSTSPEVAEFITPEKQASATAISLPSQLPDVPGGEHRSSDLAEVDRLLAKPRSILRSFFIFQQELEIDPLLSTRISAIDFKRRGFMAGSKSLKRSVVEMNAYMSAVEVSDPGLAEYMRQCIGLTLSGIRWIENLEKEEMPLIKYFLKEAKTVRPVSIYEELARRILSKYARDQWRPVPEDAQRLVASIKTEREYRKKVGQLIAWQLLREIQHSITDTSPDGLPIGFREGGLSHDDVIIYVDFPRVRGEFLATSSAAPGYSPVKVVQGLAKRSHATMADLAAVLDDLFGNTAGGGSKNVDGVRGIDSGDDVDEVPRKETAEMKAQGRIDKLSKISTSLKELVVIVDDLKRMVEENPKMEWSLSSNETRPADIPKDIDPMSSSIIVGPSKPAELPSSPPPPPSPQLSSDEEMDLYN